MLQFKVVGVRARLRKSEYTRPHVPGATGGIALDIRGNEIRRGKQAGAKNESGRPAGGAARSHVGVVLPLAIRRDGDASELRARPTPGGRLTKALAR